MDWVSARPTPPPRIERRCGRGFTQEQYVDADDPSVPEGDCDFGFEWLTFDGRYINLSRDGRGGLCVSGRLASGSRVSQAVDEEVLRRHSSARTDDGPPTPGQRRDRSTPCVCEPPDVPVRGLAIAKIYERAPRRAPRAGSERPWRSSAGRRRVSGGPRVPRPIRCSRSALALRRIFLGGFGGGKAQSSEARTDQPVTDKRYVRRRADGTFEESDDVWDRLSAPGPRPGRVRSLSLVDGRGMA